MGGAVLGGDMSGGNVLHVGGDSLGRAILDMLGGDSLDKDPVGGVVVGGDPLDIDCCCLY